MMIDDGKLSTLRAEAPEQTAESLASEIAATMAAIDARVERKRMLLELLLGKDLTPCRQCACQCDPDTCPIIASRCPGTDETPAPTR